ncbi:MAG: hypothetical protein ACJ8AO_01640 [Gemmatimonadaceae bacterium]
MTRRDRAKRPPLLAVLAELHASVEERDVGNVERLCELEARRIPREVREEALAVARTPFGGHRAPIRLLMFWRSARMLGALPGSDAADRAQLELQFPPRVSRGGRRPWKSVRPPGFPPRRRRGDLRDPEDAE